MCTKKLKNCVFSARAPLSKVGHFDAEGARRKYLWSISQNSISEISTTGGFFGSAGVRIPKGEGHPPPPPKSAGVLA